MKKYILSIDGKEFQYNSKREANKAFIEAFLNGLSVREIKI